MHGVHVRQHTPDELQLRHHRQARRPDNPVPRQDKLAALIRAGGSDDSFALAISHKSNDRIIIDAIREVRPPFSSDAVVHDFAALLKSYRVSRVTGDRYAGEFPRELFRKHGIVYDLAKQTKSELFRDLLPLLNSGRIVLPRNDRLQGQIVGLERRTSAVGRDTISHPERGHDDVANAVAGAAALSNFGGYDTSLRWVSGDDDDSGAAWSASVFKPSSTAAGAFDYDGILALSP